MRHDHSTVHGMAAEWIVELDANTSCPSDDNLIQRFIIALIYFTTSGDTWFVNDNYLSEAHECSWFGVICNEDNVIVEIQLCKHTKA